MRDWHIPTPRQWHPFVTVAETESELEKVFRLRYQKYVAEDGKKYRTARHEMGLFYDPIDTHSVIFVSTGKQGNVLASVRLTRSSDAAADPQLSKLFESVNDETVVTSRLVSAGGVMAGLSIIHMFRAVYEVGLLSGARRCVLGTRTELIAIYERFGFVLSGRSYNDSIAGEQQIMCLDLHDIEHMRRIESYLLTVAEKYAAQFDSSGRIGGQTC